MTVGYGLDRWISGFTAPWSSYHFEMNSPLATVPTLLIVAAVGCAVFAVYLHLLRNLPRTYRISLAAMRALLVVMILFFALDPCFVGNLIKPGEQYVALLFDDSKSMQVAGDDGRTRGENLRAAYQAAKLSFEDPLRLKFQIASYRFGDSLERISSLQDLRFSENKTDVEGAIHSCLMDLQSLHVAAIVVFSDGVLNGAAAHDPNHDLPRDKIPVFTVGMPEESDWKDLSIQNLSLQKTHLDKNPVIVMADIAAQGLSGHKAVVEVLEGERAVQSKTMAIDKPDQILPVRMEWIPSPPRWIDYQVRVRLSEDAAANTIDSPTPVPSRYDRVRQNNLRHVAVDHTPQAFRLLYYSGRPNWENKFIRRALQEDEQIQISSLIGISAAERKFVYRGAKTTLTNPLFEGYSNDTEEVGRYDEPIFLRIGVTESELAKGYPSDPKELFQYNLIIWGDVQRENFTTNQLELTRDFVEKRGGTLLVLGGLQTMNRENFAGTAVEPLFPVGLYAKDSQETDNDWFRASPSLEGELSGVWTLDQDPEINQKAWDDMPPLFGLIRFAFTRAGTIIQAYGHMDSSKETNEPFLMIQRYGRGKCAVTATSDTWPWQMKADKENTVHERWWRQLVRYLVDGVSRPVELRNQKDSYPLASESDLEFLARDDEFNEREGLQVNLSAIAPSAQSATLGVDESIRESGVYESSFTPVEEGMHIIKFSAMTDARESVGSATEAILVTSDPSEFRHPQVNSAYLKELAGRTGGAYFTLNQLDRIPSRIPWEMSETSETTRAHLWQVPGFFGLLSILMLVEWYLRRKKGMA